MLTDHSNPQLSKSQEENHVRRYRAVYRRYGLDKVLIALQRSGTFLIDKQGIVRYIHQVTNPQASVEKDELMREVEQLYKEETQI